MVFQIFGRNNSMIEDMKFVLEERKEQLHECGSENGSAGRRMALRR
jgi:hypothetical protein